ncbi:MAG: hypothetical protein KC776_21280, partial [Myxococcales bacterium]|nr:hypothetical protein [Myxococcales bacterium]
GGAAGSGGVAGSGGAAGSGGLPTLTSTVATCADVTTPCASVDFAQSAHPISPMLFGDGVEWQHFANGIFAPDASGVTAGAPRPAIMTELAKLGITQMRYPGGTLSDLFHWKEAVGPVASRLPQYTLDLDSANVLQKELPNFGPDEFASFADDLSMDILLTVNVGTGTAQEAADWVAYWKGKGITPKYIEIGNEMYLPSPGGTVFPPMDPALYGQKFDEYAKAIRAVEPNAKLGLIGTMDTTFWCAPNCTPEWNEQVLTNVKEKADFFAVHNAYAPGTTLDGQSVYEAMLAYPEFFRTTSSFIAQDVDFHAATVNKGLPLAITEHASFFLPTAGADPSTIIAEVERNQSWASALYSALDYQVMVSDPRIQIANHINPVSWLWQAPVHVDLPDWSSYPDSYTPNPRVSSFGLVFQAFRELADQKYVPVTLVGSPTHSTQPVGLIPELTDTPVLSAVAASGTDGHGWLLVVNRSLTDAVDFSFVLESATGATELEIDRLASSDFHEDTAAWTPVEHGLLPEPGATFGGKVSVPAASLLRLRLR